MESLLGTIRIGQTATKIALYSVFHLCLFYDFRQFWCCGRSQRLWRYVDQQPNGVGWEVRGHSSTHLQLDGVRTKDVGVSQNVTIEVNRIHGRGNGYGAFRERERERESFDWLK